MVKQWSDVGQIRLNQLKARISRSIYLYLSDILGQHGIFSVIFILFLLIQFDSEVQPGVRELLANAMVDNLEPIYGTFVIKVIWY